MNSDGDATRDDGLTWIVAPAVAVLLALLSAAVVFWQNARLGVLWDLSYVLESAYRIALGDVPYRDFPFPFPPLTFFIQAGLIKLTGRVFFHHVIYCAVMNAMATLLTWRIVLRVSYGVKFDRTIALLLILPLPVLDVYSILPHPFYDPDATVAVLAAVLLLLHFERETRSALRGVITGAAVVVPLFIKQNTGLAFLFSTTTAIVLLLIIAAVRRQPWKQYASVLIGTALTLFCALALIHFTAGLNNYWHWTIRFAAARRTPQRSAMLDIYRDSLLKWWLLLFVAGVVVARLNRDLNKIFSIIPALLWSIPFLWSAVYLVRDSDASERAERLLALWPYVLVVSFCVALIALIREQTPSKVLAFILIATVNGAFLSQQLWGSTYALWPLFMILIAATLLNAKTLLKTDSLPPLLFTVLASASLCVSGVSYVRSHERLDYADLDDGDLQHSSLPALKGLAMRGSFIPDFEELVSFSNKEIPLTDGILMLPGEDLFYYATGRRPRFPVLMFDHTLDPYTSVELVQVARDRNINWLIVKDELQLETEPVENREELLDLLMKDFEEYESLNNYEIYRRKQENIGDDGP
ncbi:MAG: hypothetical protein ABR555_08015 [Pyrinomonadaceae bacterium]